MVDLETKKDARPIELQRHLPTDRQGQLPESGFQAALRGLRNRCPSCSQSLFFAKFLKPIAHCPVCQQDWTPQQADDFPAYVAIILTGHIMVPLTIVWIKHTNLPLWSNMVIIASLTAILTGLLLQPAKGVIIALQWWIGMHGFVRPNQRK